MLSVCHVIFKCYFAESITKNGTIFEDHRLNTMKGYMSKKMGLDPTSSEKGEYGKPDKR